MIYTMMADSPNYLAATPNGHFLAQVWYRLFSVFGPAQLELAALAQIALICFSAYKFNKSMGIENKRLRWLSLAILVAPCVLWGRQVGSDALGYSLMLAAMACLGKRNALFVLFASLASVTRFQYIGLFSGLLLYRRMWWVPAVMLTGFAWVGWTGWYGMVGMYGKVYKTVEYVACSVPAKSEHVSHAEYFNLVWGSHDIPGGTATPCVCAALAGSNVPRVLWQHKGTVAQLIRSKLRFTFRWHQLAFFVLLMLAPFAGIRRVAWVCFGMYAVVILTSSPLYHRYTFMVELVMLSAVIALQDRLLALVPGKKEPRDKTYEMA